MSKRLREAHPFLHLLSRSSPKRRKLLLKQATKDELTSVFEICLNILKGNLNIGKGKTYKTLYRQCQLLRKLGDKKVPYKTKRKLVVQKERFIGTLASIALPLLTGLLGRRRRNIQNTQNTPQ